MIRLVYRSRTKPVRACGADQELMRGRSGPPALAVALIVPQAKHVADQIFIVAPIEVILWRPARRQHRIARMEGWTPDSLIDKALPAMKGTSQICASPAGSRTTGLSFPASPALLRRRWLRALVSIPIRFRGRQVDRAVDSGSGSGSDADAGAICPRPNVQAPQQPPGAGWRGSMRRSTPGSVDRRWQSACRLRPRAVTLSGSGGQVRHGFRGGGAPRPFTVSGVGRFVAKTRSIEPGGGNNAHSAPAADTAKRLVT